MTSLQKKTVVIVVKKALTLIRNYALFMSILSFNLFYCRVVRAKSKKIPFIQW